MDYAEKELGVNEVYAEAQRLSKALEDAQATLLEARGNKRSIEAEQYNREMDLVLDESEHHPEMSVAAMERHMKKVLFRDTRLKDLRDSHVAVVGEIEGLESEVRKIESDIKIVTSRMVELGGYLQYLAAIKQHQMAYKTSEAGEA